MAQIVTGIRSILNSPKVYNALQNVMGASRTRTDCVAKFMPIRAGDRVLDIGCGTADILAFLPQGIDYVGYDMSERYIAHAQQVFGDRGQFVVGLVDHAVVSNLSGFDWVIATGLLHHLDDVEASNLVRLAHSALVDGGHFVAIDPCYAEPQATLARWLISKDRGQNVRDSDGYSSLVAGTFKQYTPHLRHQAWIPYTHNILVCKK